MTPSLVTRRRLPGADPVLLVHGLASNAHTDWETTGFVAALAAAGRGAILVDLPGHGTGPALGRGQATTADIVQALAAVIADSGQDAADVVAYSLGSRLAWSLAETGRVRRLVLGGLSPMDPFGAIDVDALEAVVVGGAAPQDPMAGMFAQMLHSPGVDPAAAVGLIDALAAEPFDPAQGVPAVPTLFLAGTDDPMSQGVEALVAAVPGATLQRVPGDHVAALRSAEFRDAALTFLA